MNWELAKRTGDNEGDLLYKLLGQRELNLLEKGRKVRAAESLVLVEAGAQQKIVVWRWDHQSCRGGA